MKRIEKILSLVALVLVSVCESVCAQAGSSCGEPIELHSGYTQTVWTASKVWYIANTFDLPMAIDFYPANNVTQNLTLHLDFGCTSGDYEDPVLCSLFCKSNSVYTSLPHTQGVALSVDNNGKSRYHVEFGEFYRDMLLRQGIDYNVPVYICAEFPCGGQLTMEPDAISNCMDGAKFMHLGDTVRVRPNDGERHVIVPYVQWQYDSIQYVWQGEESCIVAVANKCNFDPADENDKTVLDRQVVLPGGVVKLSSRLLMDYVNNQTNYPNEAGMYFAKFYSASEGVIKIEEIPAPPPAEGAILLKYGERAAVNANDLNRVYAMPNSWIKDMQFVTPTSRVFRMYIGKTVDFAIEDAIATYQFDRTDDGHALYLFGNDMEALWKKQVASEQYLYIRFECTDNTYVTPSLWTPSDCMKKAKRIEAGVQFDVAAKSNVNYSFLFADWKGGDMTIAWTNTQNTCPFYIADTCNVPNSDVSPVFYTDKAPKKGSITIPTATVDSWEPKVDPDGYIYIRFYSRAQGKITVTTTAVEEEDPLCPTHDSITDIVAWDSCVWRGKTYTESGTYKEEGNVDPETGCVDTLFTLNLNVRTTSYDTYEETGCDSIVYHYKTYKESGVYRDTVGATGGNRVIMDLYFTIKHSSASEETKEACDSYEWHDQTYTQSGDYTYRTMNAVDCDSIVTLHLTIKHPAEGEETQEACVSYDWNGQTYTQSGDYTYRFSEGGVCDSVATLHLTIKQPTQGEETQEACGFYEWHDQTYTQSGDYTYRTTNAAGCDSVVTLHLTITNPAEGEETQEACGSYEWNGQTYTQSGDYVYRFSEGGVCDSVATLHLTIKQPTQGEETQEACGSYEWEGEIFTTSGDYTKTLTNVAGCDSTATLHLTIYTPHGDTDTTAVAWDSIVWYGKTYKESGEYPITKQDEHECDYTHTLLLTVHTTARDTMPMHGCDSLIYEEKKYTEDGVYVLDTAIIADENRMIHYIAVTLGTTLRDEKEEPDLCGSYIAPSGAVFTESGVYSDTTYQVDGCMSILTLRLEFQDDCTTYDTVYFCDGQNTKHLERWSPERATYYMPYRYESPAEWDYMEGVIVSQETSRALVDLKRAEQNLYAHYVDSLTSVTSIVWSYRLHGASSYSIIQTTDEPQWIETGVVALTVRFVCGQMFTTDFTTDLESISDERLSSGQKILQDGQIIIIRNGIKYNLLGTKIE